MTSIATSGRNVLAELEEVVEIFEREAEGGDGSSGPLARGAAGA